VLDFSGATFIDSAVLKELGLPVVAVPVPPSRLFAASLIESLSVRFSPRVPLPLPLLAVMV
jgi:hypothetical protein